MAIYVTSKAMTTPALFDLEGEETTPATPARTPAKRRLGLGGPRLGGGGPVQVTQSSSKQLRLGQTPNTNQETPKLSRLF